MTAKADNGLKAPVASKPVRTETADEAARERASLDGIEAFAQRLAGMSFGMAESAAKDAVRRSDAPYAIAEVQDSGWSFFGPRDINVRFADPALPTLHVKLDWTRSDITIARSDDAPATSLLRSLTLDSKGRVTARLTRDMDRFGVTQSEDITEYSRLHPGAKVSTTHYVANEPVKPLSAIYANDSELDRHRLAVAARTDRELVAVMDTGVDYNNPEIAYRIPRIDGQPIGLDLIDNDDLPYDAETQDIRAKHGTGVAYTLGRDDDDIAILPIRTSLSPEQFAKATAFAYERGARIVNISMAGTDATLAALADTMRKYPDVAFIAAAGNARRNIDTAPSYPAALHLPNLLSAAAVDAHGSFAEGFSNYGLESVQVAALGVGVRTAEPGNTWNDKRQGTSYSAPTASRTVARLRHRDHSLGPADLFSIVEHTVHPVASLRRYVTTGGIIDDAAAIAELHGVLR